MSSNSRQRLYDRIRASSKDEVILEEMKRLGFWPDDQGKPEASEALIKRKGQLQQELSELLKKQHMYQNPEEALKLMRKERMAESKKRRLENKKKRIQLKHDKALNWYQRRRKEILYLGSDVSNGLNHVKSDAEKLSRFNLPDLRDASAIAEAMGIALSELRFLSFSREISRVCHYRRFSIAKKTGGERIISAPMPRLKRAQYWILDNILEKIPLHDTAHGFRRARSIVSNAKPHTNAYIVINYDLKDFFPTLNYARVKGLFMRLGYSNQVATIFALMCTEPDVQQVTLDGDHYYVRQGERHLPQGSPCSPAITNIICRRLDRRLNGAAKSLGYTYTRYADDMSFSGDRSSAKKLGKLQWRIRQIVSDEGFELHPEKTRIMRANNRQEVTGIVVNDKPSLDRKTLKRFRALLYQIEKDGPEGKRWGNSGNVLSAIKGFANYIRMVDAGKGSRYREQVNRIINNQGFRHQQSAKSDLSTASFRAAAATGKAPREPWWQPTELPEPVLPTLDEQRKPVAKKPDQGDTRSTREVIDSAIRDSRRGPHMPRHGTWRRWLVKLKALFWWFVILYVAFMLMRTSPVLGVIFLGLAIFFRSTLRGF